MKKQQCETCVSRRLCGDKLGCSLGVNKYLRENENCGTYEYSEYGMNDYEFEYGGISIDKLNELWLSGKEV